MMETYYRLYLLIKKIPRIQPKAIAREFRKTGRGRSPSTFLRHINNMYQKEISYPPRLTLRTFRSSYNTVYFCRKSDKQDVYPTFLDLHQNEMTTYIMLLSGCDFFIISRERDLDLSAYGLKIEEKSILYTPMFTTPRNYLKETGDAFDEFLGSEFEKGNIKRDILEPLTWSKKQWEVYDAIKENIRCKFSAVAHTVGISPKTVKTYFLEKIIPNCVVANYFFPKGYQNYQKMFLRIKSDYETSIVGNLGKLPCTSYVYPLENELAVVIFHDDEPKVLETLQKMREMGTVNDYLIHVPILHGY
ncbi:MAG: hypothetical protein AYK18_18245 [Theionarchaea archaeon DG-70]|nr:MAG: hypothetical protein AYK18_18245 [Theionarchaea archaeon DG-70]